MTVATIKILITGCHGQVGRFLVRQLQSYPNGAVLATSRKELDISNQTEVDKVVLAFKPNIIINAAAYTTVDEAEKEVALSYAVNQDGPYNLAKAAEHVGAAMLHISTDYVFSGDKNETYKETDATHPQCVYGQSKLAGEKAVVSMCSKYIILRTSWLFGEYGNNFVKTMLRLGEQKDSVGVVGDQFGGPTYAGDVADTLVRIATEIITQGDQFNFKKYGTYHFSGLPYVSWYEFAKAIFTNAVEQRVLIQSPIVHNLKTEQYPTPAKRPANSKLDSTKITTTFNIKASNWQKALSHLKSY